MKNERDVEFTPDPSTAGQGVEFTPSPALEGTSGGSTSGGTQPFGTGTTGGYNAGSFGTGTGAGASTTGGFGSTGTTGSTGTMGGATGSGGSTGSEGTGGLRAAASEQLGQAKELVGQVQERAAEQVRTRIDAQKTRASESLSSVAQTLRSSGEQVGQEPISRYLNRAADEVENLASFLGDRDVGEILGQVEDFARKQPVAFLGGAFTLGVLGARFLKSSRSNLYSTGGGYGGGYDAGGAQWNNQELTSRVPNPERDAVGRPDAPGYAPPTERAGSDYKAAGPRQDY